MKNSVPFLDEELLVREKQVTFVKPKAAVGRAGSSRAGATKTRAPSGSAPTLKKASPEAIAPSTVARVYWHPIQNGHCLKINISGKPDIRCLGQWRRLLKDCQRHRSQRFEIDLEETGDFGLAALALLLMLKDVQQVKTSDFILNQCSQELFRLLQWTGLNGAFTVRAVKARNG